MSDPKRIQNQIGLRLITNLNTKPKWTEIECEFSPKSEKDCGDIGCCLIECWKSKFKIHSLQITLSASEVMPCYAFYHKNCGIKFMSGVKKCDFIKIRKEI